MPIHDWTRVPDAIFHSFHGGWITALVDTANEELLPDGYYAGGGKQIPGMEPDVMPFDRAFRRRRSVPRPRRTAAGGDGLAAGTPAGGRPSSTMEPRDDGLEYRGTPSVVRRSGDDHMVAVIEIVSAGNNGAASRFDTFLLQGSRADRGGRHPRLVDAPAGTAGPPGVCTRRSGRG